jgi:hypothetical protein
MRNYVPNGVAEMHVEAPTAGRGLPPEVASAMDSATVVIPARAKQLQHLPCC